MGGETELLRRLSAAGHRAWFAADARVRHIVRPEQLTEAWILERAYRYGLGEGRHHLGRLGVPGLALHALASNARALALRPFPPSPRRLRALFRARCLSGALAGVLGGLASRARVERPPGAASVPDTVLPPARRPRAEATVETS
jgi:hypothetical protein